MSLFSLGIDVIRHPFLSDREDSRGDLVPSFHADEPLKVYGVSLEGVDTDERREPGRAEVVATIYAPSSQQWSSRDELTIHGRRYRVMAEPNRYDGVDIDGQVVKARWTGV